MLLLLTHTHAPVTPCIAAFRASPPAASIAIRAVTIDDVPSLANLCADALYGEAELLRDGPIICAQRQKIVQGMKRNFARRVGFESNPDYGVGDEQEIKFFVAEDEPSGKICGCLDMAVHLFDKRAGAFDLEIDEMPADPELRLRWSPYIASLSVSRPMRGRGVGRELVREAEAWAKRKGYGEVMLEVRMRARSTCHMGPVHCTDTNHATDRSAQVSQSNSNAIRFYERGGYKVLSSFDAGEAGGGGEDVSRNLFWWDIRPAPKYVMRKQLRLFFREKRD